MWTVILALLAIIGMFGAGFVIAPTTIVGMIAWFAISAIVGSWAVLVGRKRDGAQ